jgi:catechol 2,3-dioxygenase-like lactoylglutathione lyase family enzyme
MKVLFISSFSPIVSDPADSREFYAGKLGVPLDKGEGDYVFTDTFEGAKHFGLWPLRDAARSCFGTDTWPDDVVVPQASVEFEVEDVEAAAAELVDAGLELVHPVKTEPWGQVIARLLSPDGLLVGVTWVPWYHPTDGKDE